MKQAVLAVLGALVLSAGAHAGGELYGTIRTTGGETLTGPIRWDNNENFWDDRLDTGKDKQARADGDKRSFSFSLFGLKIGGDDSGSAFSFSIPFGHLKTIEPLPGRKAQLTLKSGEVITVVAKNDLGHGLRSVIVDDAKKGRVKLGWGSLERVEFKQNPGEGRDHERLFGKVVTEHGTFEGFVVWDRDESLIEDVLDGYDGSADREIEFGRIRSIAPLERGGCKVTLKDGSAMELHGTNDVDHGQRGVAVLVEGVGSVEVDWEELEIVEFRDPPASRKYATFDGGRRVKGRVTMDDGRTFAGAIEWDEDEVYTWESLDGEFEEIDYVVTLGNVSVIKRVDSHSSEIQLRNGDVLTLSGTNDVDDSNRGLYITGPDGTETSISWNEVKQVVFE